MTNLTIKKEYCEETIRLKENIEVAFLDLGERLMRIRDERLYENNWDAFEDFLMEVKISSGTASKLINIYQRFVLEYKISTKKIALAGGWSIVAECLPLVKTKDEALEWLEKAGFMTQTDIRREMKEAKTGIMMKDCEHDWTYIKFRTCEKCSLKERVYEEKSKEK
jgi:hypothetical protein